MDLFAVRLKDLRQNKAVTQKEVANVIGISDRAYRAFEIGTSKPAFETLLALCDYYDVSADFLLCRTDKSQSHKS